MWLKARIQNFTTHFNPIYFKFIIGQKHLTAICFVTWYELMDSDILIFYYYIISHKRATTRAGLAYRENSSCPETY